VSVLGIKSTKVRSHDLLLLLNGLCRNDGGLVLQAPPSLQQQLQRHLLQTLVTCRLSGKPCLFLLESSGRLDFGCLKLWRVFNLCAIHTRRQWPLELSLLIVLISSFFSRWRWSWERPHVLAVCDHLIGAHDIKLQLFASLPFPNFSVVVIPDLYTRSVI